MHPRADDVVKLCSSPFSLLGIYSIFDVNFSSKLAIPVCKKRALDVNSGSSVLHGLVTCTTSSCKARHKIDNGIFALKP